MGGRRSTMLLPASNSALLQQACEGGGLLGLLAQTKRRGMSKKAAHQMVERYQTFLSDMATYFAEIDAGEAAASSTVCNQCTHSCDSHSVSCAQLRSWRWHRVRCDLFL